MNLLLLESTDVENDGEISIRGARANHLRRVWQVQPGDTVPVAQLDGWRGSAVVRRLESDGSVLLRVARKDHSAQDLPRVDLLIAMPRPKAMKRLWAELAAIGVGTVIVSSAALVDRSYFTSHALHPDVVRARLLEGLAQARANMLPQVVITRSLEHGLKRAAMLDCDAFFMADPQCTIASAWGETPPGRVLVAIGPDAGWTVDERARMRELHYRGIGLPGRALRTETAAVGLVFLMNAWLSEAA